MASGCPEKPNQKHFGGASQTKTANDSADAETGTHQSNVPKPNSHGSGAPGTLNHFKPKSK